MEDPHTNQPLPPMIRLPQISPDQGKTTLRHFASPAPSSAPPAAPVFAQPAPFSQTSPVQVKPEQAFANNNGASFANYRQSKRTRIPGTFRREFSLREILMGCTVLLAIVIIALVLIYYLTLF